MARLAIDKDFFDDCSKQHKLVQRTVKTPVDKLAEHVRAGFHLVKITHYMDDRIRSPSDGSSCNRRAEIAYADRPGPRASATRASECRPGRGLIHPNR